MYKQITINNPTSIENQNAFIGIMGTLGYELRGSSEWTQTYDFEAEDEDLAPGDVALVSYFDRIGFSIEIESYDINYGE